MMVIQRLDVVIECETVSYTVNAKGFPKGITGVFLLACM